MTSIALCSCARSQIPDLAVTLLASKHHVPTSLGITPETAETGDDASIEFRETTMLAVQLLPGAISEILASVTDTGALTVADRYGLMAAVLDESLEEEDRNSVNRLLRSVMKGKVKVVPELSAVI